MNVLVALREVKIMKSVVEFCIFSQKKNFYVRKSEAFYVKKRKKKLNMNFSTLTGTILPPSFIVEVNLDIQRFLLSSERRCRAETVSSVCAGTHRHTAIWR